MYTTDAGGNTDARRLQCELCRGSIAAKLSLAPYSVLLFDKDGRGILLTFVLRLAYRLFLFRRLYTRWASSYAPPTCTCALCCSTLTTVLSSSATAQSSGAGKVSARARTRSKTASRASSNVPPCIATRCWAPYWVRCPIRPYHVIVIMVLYCY